MVLFMYRHVHALSVPTRERATLINQNLFRHAAATPLALFTFWVSLSSAVLSQEVGPDSTEENKLIKGVGHILSGFTVGADTRVFPYASLEDWFDPFVALKLGHRSFGNSGDRVFHHFKFEGPRDYSWKFRYLARSLSSENTRFSFLLKRKIDRDPYFYGIGNATRKPARLSATYASVFFGFEIEQNVAQGAVFRVSPGFWKFTSGRPDGSEFEQAPEGEYVSSRFTLSDKKVVDYWRGSLDNQWAGYVEVALPVNTSASSYMRLNLETLTQLPLFMNTKLRVGTRFEWLVSTDRDRLPYFAVSEVGSRNGLRGFSKERFRNFALAVFNFEFSFPLTHNLDAFMLTDMAQTGLSPDEILGNKIHADFGFGFRIRNTRHPLAFGIAASHESFKLFSAIAVGSPW